MRAPLAITPLVTGDPVRPRHPIATLAELGAALALDDPCVLPLGPGVVLVHALRPVGAHLGCRVVHLRHALAIPPAGAVAVAVVFEAPIEESGRVARLAGRLRAAFTDAALVDRVARATTREEIVRALSAIDLAPDENPLAAEELLALLRSGATGLDDHEAARRLVACGPNRLERVRARPLALRLLEQFTTFFAALLWVASAFAYVAGMAELAIAIVLVVLVNGAGSFVQEYRAERALRALEDLLPRTIGARRGGRPATVPTTSLVPGDVVRLDEGDQVPADAQLLGPGTLRVDQSALTGEPHPVFKLASDGNARARVPRLERHELVFAGTSVVSGAGEAIVIATGMHTEIGDVAQLTQAIAEAPSPLQREMRRVTHVVTALAVAFGLVFFVLGVTTGLLRPGEGLLFALGVIVANVPEGLLPTLTLALALGAQRMARLGSLVRRLSAIETLGATTVICTDKTGTLTEGRMAARAVWLPGRTLAAGDVATDGARDLRRVLTAAVLASHATRDQGDPTEVALVAIADAAGIDAEKVRGAHPSLHVLPFDSFRKRMTIVRTGGRASHPSAEGHAVAFVKGAPRETLALCTRIQCEAGVVPLTDDRRAAVLADHDRLAADGLRLLAIAERPVDAASAAAGAAAVERDLTLLGLVALWDPPRAEVAPAIAVCRRAGIRVVMATGDYGLTAQAIARRIGLEPGTVVTGDEVERMSGEALRRLVRRADVLFARTSPAHKLAVVEALRADGEIVAVTGDGVNDAPALKAADIGVAMGRRGTEVAREAAEMVITDDNFASIVAAVRQGRAIYANMGKFVRYIFASNVPELVPFLAFVLAGIPLPLTVMQILAVDLGTDLLPALALGAEPPEPGVMERPPRRADERLLDAGRLLHAYGFLGVIEAALALAAFFWTYWLAGWRPGLPMASSGDLYVRATTMTLAGIVAAQVGNVFACRTDRASVFRAGFLSNRLVFAGIVAELAILVALMVVPPLPGLFGVAPLAPAEWALLLPFPFVVLGLEEARKAIVRGPWYRRG